MKRDSVELGQGLGFLVIADDREDVASQLACVMPVEQVGQAVVVVRKQDHHLGSIIRRRQVIVDLVLLSYWREVFLERRDWNIETLQVPFQARQEYITVGVDVIVSVQDAAMMCHQELGNGGDGSFARQGNRSAEQ